jgi:hypothetical protein
LLGRLLPYVTQVSTTKKELKKVIRTTTNFTVSYLVSSFTPYQAVLMSYAVQTVSDAPIPPVCNPLPPCMHCPTGQEICPERDDPDSCTITWPASCDEF